MSISPTSAAIARRRSKSRKNGRATIVAGRRVDPPKIFVALESKLVWESGRFAEAHLRNKKGYVYLCWRDGDRVRNFYLGKAPRKSPTAASAFGRAARDRGLRARSAAGATP
jgi:hypothetical protein